MARLIGVPTSNIIGRAQDDVLREAYYNNTGVKIGPSNINDWIASLKENQRNLSENEFIFNTSDNKYFKLYRLTVSSGDHVVFGTDITELIETQKELEEALKKLDELANTCDLSGVPNRRYIMEAVNREFFRAKRYNSMFSIVIADIDHFKKVNDTYGHGVGDKAIIHFSKLLSNSLREADLIGRIGGEEFAILLPNTHEKNALKLADRIRQKISDTPLTLDDKRALTITSSFGVSQFNAVDTDESAVFARADEALYRAKESGRNRASL